MSPHVRPPWMSDAIYRNCPKRDLTEIVTCPGCDMKFGGVARSRTVRPEVGFMIHCVEKCPKYKKLGLVKECQPCGLKFVNDFGFKNHLASDVHKFRHYRRDWIPLNLVIISSNIVDYDTKIKCPGCDQQFPARSVKDNRKVGVIKPRIDYYVHCVEECQRFISLNLISPCKFCPLVFLRPDSLFVHLRVHSEELSKAKLAPKEIAFAAQSSFLNGQEISDFLVANDAKIDEKFYVDLSCVEDIESELDVVNSNLLNTESIFSGSENEMSQESMFGDVPELPFENLLFTIKPNE